MTADVYEMQAECALDYCQKVLGWKDAYIPSPEEMKDGWPSSYTVYKYKPKDMWDTPEEFYFNQLEKK